MSAWGTVCHGSVLQEMDMTWERSQGILRGARGTVKTCVTRLRVMDVLIEVVVGLHIIGIAALLGGFLTQMKVMGAGEARIVPAMMHGAWTMLVTGLALVGLNQADDQEVNNTKIGVKLAVLLAILVLAYVNRDEDRVNARVFGAIGLLTVANVFIATTW
jgi:hypothetical protein